MGGRVCAPLLPAAARWWAALSRTFGGCAGCGIPACPSTSVSVYGVAAERTWTERVKEPNKGRLRRIPQNLFMSISCERMCMCMDNSPSSKVHAVERAHRPSAQDARTHGRACECEERPGRRSCVEGLRVKHTVERHSRPTIDALTPDGRAKEVTKASRSSEVKERKVECKRHGRRERGTWSGVAPRREFCGRDPCPWAARCRPERGGGPPCGCANTKRIRQSRKQRERGPSKSLGPCSPQQPRFLLPLRGATCTCSSGSADRYISPRSATRGAAGARASLQAARSFPLQAAACPAGRPRRPAGSSALESRTSAPRRCSLP